MKSFLFALAITLSFSSQAEEVCRWVTTPPSVYRCNGQNYVYGSMICTESGYIKNIFCSEKFSDDSVRCRGETSQYLRGCYNKMIGYQNQTSKSAEACDWKDGPYPVLCVDKKAVFGSMKCTATGMHENIVCSEEFKSDAKKCIDDVSDGIKKCQETLRQPKRMFVNEVECFTDDQCSKLIDRAGKKNTKDTR